MNQNLFSCSSGSWKVQGWRTATVRPHMMESRRQGDERGLNLCFYNPMSHLPKVPPSNAVTMATKFQHEFWRGQAFKPQHWLPVNTFIKFRMNALSKWHSGPYVHQQPPSATLLPQHTEALTVASRQFFLLASWFWLTFMLPEMIPSFQSLLLNVLLIFLVCGHRQLIIFPWGLISPSVEGEPEPRR